MTNVRPSAQFLQAEHVIDFMASFGRRRLYELSNLRVLVLANWLVGMAAFFAMMGRTIVGKYVPVMLAVTMFVAAGFQHSPANMGYFALWMAETGQGPGWATALWWNIIPAGLGNMVGATVFVSLPFWYVFRPTTR